MDQPFTWRCSNGWEKPILWMRPHIVTTWIFHYDNAPYYNALSACEFLSQWTIPIIPLASYSPDLVPCDYFLFLKMKRQLSENILGQFPTTGLQWREWYKHLPKTSSTATTNRKVIGTGPLVIIDVILKEIIFTFNKLGTILINISIMIHISLIGNELKGLDSCNPLSGLSEHYSVSFVSLTQLHVFETPNTSSIMSKLIFI